jgi:tRNA1Val (adenine37-N6)-methyltransferase
MKKSNPFKFKQFEIIQNANPQKVGTDSMLLGAWSKGNFKRILDIGTGTGILALMMAQKFDAAEITAIEPNPSSQEALLNFRASIFSDRILSINSTIQQFGSIDKFDLIICNPPYFNGTYLSEQEDRNTARHTLNLPAFELFESAADLLSAEGRFNLVIPFDIETEYIERAFDHDLFIQEILHTLSPNGTKKRSLISFGFEDVAPAITELLVKDAANNYSAKYIALTKDFYFKEL